METPEFLSVWIWPLVAGLSFLSLVVVAYRYIIQRVRINRFQAVMKYNWTGYIEALSDTFRRLKSLRAVLAEVRPRAEEQDLAELNKLLFDKIRDEIRILDEKLKKMSVASDRQWQTMRVEWIPMVELHGEISRFISLARKGIPPETLEKLKAQWEQEAANRNQEKIKKLERDNNLLKDKVEGLEKTTAGHKSVKRGVLEDEEAAARLMGKLADNLTMNDVEAKLAAAKGEINFIEKQFVEGVKQDERAALSAKLKWAKQSRRWWNMQRKLRKQTLLLDEATGRATEMSGDQNAGREEGIKEFQQIEAKNAELNKKISELSAINLRLTRQLDQINSESTSTQDLKEQMARAEQGRKTAEREMTNLEKMLQDMERSLKKANAENQSNRDLADKLKEKEELLAKQNKRVSELESESLKMVMSLKKQEEGHKTEVKKLDSQLIKFLEDIKEGNVEGMVPEDEMMELQTEYDKLNAEIMHFKGAVKHAEQNEAKALEEKGKLEREQREILAKYKELLQRSQ